MREVATCSWCCCMLAAACDDEDIRFRLFPFFFFPVQQKKRPRLLTEARGLPGVSPAKASAWQGDPPNMSELVPLLSITEAEACFLQTFGLRPLCFDEFFTGGGAPSSLFVVFWQWLIKLEGKERKKLWWVFRQDWLFEKTFVLFLFCVYGYSRVFRLDEILDNVFSWEFLRKSLKLPETEILFGGLFF